MVSPRTILVLLLLTTNVACFRETAPEPPAPEQAAPAAITLHDLQGAVYPPDAAPRDLRVQLRLGDATPGLQPGALILLRGEYRAALVEKLGTARLPARVRAEATPFTLAVSEDGAALTPAEPLLPGARYTLLLRDARPPHAFAFRVSDSPALGARVVALLPGDAATAVPRNLARALVQLDGELAGGDAPLAGQVRLTAVIDGRDVPVPTTLERTPCATLGLAPGTCLWLHPTAQLAARQLYRLDVPRDLRTPAGAAIPPRSATFVSADDEDHLPPTLTATPCAPDELPLGMLCVLPGDARLDVRGSLSEVALVTLALPPAQWSAIAMERTFVLHAVPQGDAPEALLRLRDLAGNLHDEVLRLPAATPLAHVSIDEVRADPRGPEPAQEYVELLNSGPNPVSLMGFTLSTDRGRARTLQSDATLAPGARALLVGPAFAPDDAADGVLPQGVALLRLDAALSLSNAGAPLILRDARGRRISAAPALTPLVEGQCSARRGPDLRSGASEQFALDPDGHCTPGRATFEP